MSGGGGGGETPLAKIVCNCNINKYYFHEVKGENLCQAFLEYRGKGRGGFELCIPSR